MVLGSFGESAERRCRRPRVPKPPLGSFRHRADRGRCWVRFVGTNWLRFVVARFFSGGRRALLIQTRAGPRPLGLPEQPHCFHRITIEAAGPTVHRNTVGGGPEVFRLYFGHVTTPGTAS